MIDTLKLESQHSTVKSYPGVRSGKETHFLEAEGLFKRAMIYVLVLIVSNIVMILTFSSIGTMK